MLSSDKSADWISYNLLGNGLASDGIGVIDGRQRLTYVGTRYTSDRYLLSALDGRNGSAEELNFLSAVMPNVWQIFSETNNTWVKVMFENKKFFRYFCHEISILTNVMQRNANKLFISKD